MNEEQIALLKSLGYTVNYYGGIIDESGNYVDSVNYEGDVINSFQTRDEYDSMMSKNKQLEEIGFTPSAESQDNIQTQQEIALAKKNLKTYQEDVNAPTPDFSDPYTKAAFDQLQIENQKQHGGVYISPEKMQEALEEGTVYEDIDDPGLKEDLKSVIKELDEIETKDPSYVAKSKKFIEETNRELEENSWYNPENISLHITNAVDKLATFALPDGAGMKDPELRKRYEELLSKKRELLLPVASTKLGEVDAQIAQADAKIEELDEGFSLRNFGYGILGVPKSSYMSQNQIDADRIRYAKKKLESQKNNLQDFIDDKNYDSNIFTTDTVSDFASVGLLDLADAVAYDLPLVNKIEAGEELSDSERTLVDAHLKEGDVQSKGFEQNFWHEVTGGTVESAKFMVGMMGGRVLSRGGVRAVRNRVTGRIGAAMAGITDISLQSALHSGSYSNGVDKYMGAIESRVDEDGNEKLLVRQELYNVLIGEADNYLESLDKKLEAAKTPEEKKALNDEIKRVELSKKLIDRPASIPDAVAYGFVTNAKEAATEMYGGRIAGALGINRISNVIQKTKRGKAVFNAVFNNSVSRGILKGRNKGVDAINKAFGEIPGSKLIGSNTEEIFEEILVQGTPEYGQNWEQYKQQASELGTVDFYAKVAAQTLLMNKLFQSGGVAKKYYNIATMGSDARAKRKATIELYKELGNRNLSEEQFNEVLMNVGTSSAVKKAYDNKIVKLRNEGKVQEANELEQDKIFLQAVAAQSQGRLNDFRKSLNKAKFNENLSPDTIANIEMIKSEVDAMANDKNNYINNNEVIKLKSKRRFTQKIKDKVDAEINNLDHGKINEEIDGILKKLNIDDYSSTVDHKNPALLDYYDKNFDSLSPELQTWLTFSSQRTELETSINGFNDRLKKVTSFDHQTGLMNEQQYMKALDNVNKGMFGGAMTAEQFKVVAANIPANAKKHIPNARIEEINKQVQSDLEVQELFRQASKPQQDTAQPGSETSTQEKDLKKSSSGALLNFFKSLVLTEGTQTSVNNDTSTTVENQQGSQTVAPDNVKTKTQEILQQIVLETAPQGEQTVVNPFDNEKNVTVNNNDVIDFLPSEDMIDEFKHWADVYKTQEGAVPVFQDFFDASLEAVENDKSVFDKNTIKYMGENWEAAGLGKSNWEKLYKDNYTDLKQVTANMINKIIAPSEGEVADVTENPSGSNTDPINPVENPNTSSKTTDTKGTGDVETINNKSEEKSIQKIEPGASVDPITGEVMKVTPVTGKTSIVTPKANFSALEYKNKRTVEEVDGKKVITYTKEDAEEVPVLNESSFVDHKALLHPDKNNPGDIWQVNVSTESEWGDSRLKVSVNDPITGENKEYISFPEWIKRNQPEGMSLDEFKNTPEFINKVPMYYSDKEGNNVSFVPDVDWYSPMSVRDTSLEVDEVVDLNNPTTNHQKKIQEGKDSTKQLRQSIIDGTVKEVTVLTKDGSPFTFIPKYDNEGNLNPPKTLINAAPDNKVAMFKGDYFVNLDGSPVDMSNIEIVNLDTLKEQSVNDTTPQYRAYYLSPINKTDKKQRFIAIGVLRKNENNQEQAMSEDVQTAKYILAANAALKYGKTIHGVTKNQAESIRKQIRQTMGDSFDIINFDSALSMVNGLIALQGPGNSKYTAYSKNISIPGTKSSYFIDALFSGKFTPVQNTNIGDKSAGVVIKQDGYTFSVEKLGENYEEFLKHRLSTNVVSYNMGTEENPAYTASVQPIMQVEAIVSEAGVTQEEVADTTADDSIDVEDALNDALSFLDSINGSNAADDISDIDNLPPSLDNVDAIKDALNVIPGLTLDQQKDVTNYLMADITAKYDLSKELTVKEFNDSVAESFNKYFTNLETQLVTHYNNLNKFYEADPVKNAKILPAIENISANLQNVETVIANYDKFFTKAYLEGMRKGFIASTIKSNNELQEELHTHDQDEMMEKDHNKSSNQVIHKDKLSNKLKRLFASVSNGKKGFLGLPSYEGYDTMYNTISTMLIAPFPTDATFDAMMGKLDMMNTSFTWMKPLTDKLKKAGQEVKNSFVSNMYKYQAKAKFVAFTEQPNGIDSAVWFSNANNLKQKIKDNWNDNFKRSDITNGNTINTEKLKVLHNQWVSWGDKKYDQPQEVLEKWLGEFGISLSDGTWEALRNGEFVIGSGKKARQLDFNGLFLEEKNRGGRLFSNLAKYAEQYKDSEQGKLNYVTNSKVHPYNDMNNIFRSLVDIEMNHNNTLANVTRRDGDDTVSEIIHPNFFLHNVDKLLKSATSANKTYLNQLKKLSFSKGSYVLDLLQNNADFAGIFDYGEVGLMSMKKLFTKNPSYANIDQLSPADYMFHQRTMFQDMKTEKFSISKDGFSMRVGVMSTPTNSDKGRMMLLKTAVFDLFKSPNAFEKQSDGTFKFTEELNELVYKNLVLPELERIINHKPTNIKGYDKGAVRFNLIPGLNTIVNEQGVTALQFLQGSKDTEAFKAEFFTPMSNFLEKLIKAESEKNLETTKSFVDENQVDKFNNQDYLNQRDDLLTDEKMLVAEYDYVINSMLSNMNTLQLISGDPAIYYKASGDPLSSNPNVQNQMSRDIGTNLGKRLALMIAPGTVLGESQDKTYMQIFLEDQNAVAQNAEQIIGWHYGKDSLKETYKGKTYQEHINDLRNDNITGEDLEQLQLRFSKVADFLTIETTDAQEYTTLREHLDNMLGLGRVTEEQRDTILAKHGKEKLSKEELNLVLQPIKPVYTGDMVDEKQDVRRIMYIKSSSFPLIHDLVDGTDLEPLMTKMQDMETEHQTTVRASYQSANKVGALNDPINPFDPESLSKIDELDTETGYPIHALKLDRINFKIQQDVPFKSDYQTEDKVSMGTQIFKLLFGDGMDKLDGFELNGESLSGRELKSKFFDAFSAMIDIQKGNLLESLGLDEDYVSDNPLEAATKLQELLVSEAEERGFPENDIKSLEIQNKTINGNDVHHFKLPLWFSGNSNKFESMLNAIINNKIFKQKLPGNAFVVGSEAGMQIKEGVEHAGNNIVFIGDYKGGELKGTQVLAPSKLRMDGKLIDLFEKNENGAYIYIKETEGGFEINEDKIDPALFENFTFRTPTSSHGSASNIQIVGFIPSVMGDLMITPKNFVAQMGQDFDIDKLTSYQYWTSVNNGKIEKLTKEGVDAQIAELRSKITETEKKLDSLHQGDTKAIKKLESEINDLIDNISPETGEELQNKEAERDALFEKLDDKYTLRLDKLEDIIENIERKSQLKLAQNDFIGIHNAVYKNPSAAVQRKINKVLSMDFAEAQAIAIDALNTNNSSAEFNMLSPQYQMDKMIAGSTGSAAIGIYAKGVTFNSLAQQADNKIKLLGIDENGNPHAKEVRIGGIVSDGTIGLEKTLSKENATEFEKSLARDTAQVQDERVNTATDNEKAQILGRVGITDLTAVAVDNLLSLLGVDAEINKIDASEYDANNKFHKKTLVDGKPVYYTEYSIPYLLHSQPIIKEYFNRVKNAKAIIQPTVNFNAEEEIMNELLMNFTSDPDFTINFTGESLIDEISSGNINSNFQKEVLTFYASLIDDAEQLKQAQDVVDMSNLGKSMWELQDKIEKFKAIPTNSHFLNISELLGTFTSEDGELPLGDNIYFTPTTNQGAMVGTAMSLGRHLFFDYFPYYDEYVAGKVESVEELSGYKGNPVKFKETIFQEIKKYITAATRNNLFTGTPSQERESLFMSKNGNTSLSTYTANILNLSEQDLDNADNKDYKKGINAIKNNVLVSSLRYEKGEAGKPDLIKFDNTEVSYVSEEHFHAAFKELLIKDIPLPSKNGEPYSTRILAQELVAYSHLSGGIVREAVEFHRFIPIEYYDSLTNPNTGTTVTRALQNYDTKVASWTTGDRLAFFNEQFFQNNPEFATQVSDKNLKAKDGRFEYNVPMAEYPAYISKKNKTKSKLKQDKWSIYRHIGSNQYEQIDVLGEFGMSEYDYSARNLKSVIEKPEPKEVKNPKTVTLKQQVTNAPPVNTPNTEFSISSSDTVQDVLNNIAGSTINYNPSLSIVAQALMDMFQDKLLTTKIVMDTSISGRGFANNKENTITLNPTKPKLAETFIHEFIHSVTVANLKPYFNAAHTDLVVDNAPSEIQALNVLFSEYRNQIRNKYGKEFATFENKFKAFKQTGKTQGFSDFELEVLYAATNVKEFLAVSLGNNQLFLEETSKIPYKKAGLSIKDKFIKVLDALLSRFSGVESNLAEQILGTSLAVVQKLNTNSGVSQQVTPEEMEQYREQIERQMPDDPGFNGPSVNIGFSSPNTSSLPDCI